MKTNSKQNTIFTVQGILSNFNHAKAYELFSELVDINESLEVTRRQLMYDFKENDVEAQQLIDNIELKQHYLQTNIVTLNKAILIQETRIIQKQVFSGLRSTYSLN